MAGTSAVSDAALVSAKLLNVNQIVVNQGHWMRRPADLARILRLNIYALAVAADN